MNLNHQISVPEITDLDAPMSHPNRSALRVMGRSALFAALALLATLIASPAFAGEPWPNDCGSPPDPCCLIPCSSFCSSTAAKCDAGCLDVDPDCCDDPCGASCSSTQAKCEAACEDVDPECCDDPCGSACESTSAKCEAGCEGVDQACCDDPCGSACSSTSAKCEAGCSDVDQACCDDPCGSACSSTSAKCEAGCSDVDQACCDDPCGSSCGSPAAKCEAGCGDVDQACCEDPCSSACTDMDAKCEAACSDLPENCCSEGMASEEGCECPELSCSSTLFGAMACSGELLTLPLSITNTVDTEEDCVTTFDWEVTQEAPIEGPVLSPPVTGSVVLAPGESADAEAIYEISPGASPGLAHMRLGVSADGAEVCSATADAEVERPDASGVVELSRTYLSCPTEPNEYRIPFTVTVNNIGNCSRDFTWTLERIAGPILFLDLPTSGTTGILEPGQQYVSSGEDFNISQSSPEGIATLRLTVKDDGRVVDVKTVTFELTLLDVDGDAGDVVACLGQTAQVPRSLTSNGNCHALVVWTASKIGGNAQINILNPVTSVEIGGEAPPVVPPLQVEILPGSADGSTATIRHEVRLEGALLWSGTSLVTARVPQCVAQLADENACAGTGFSLPRQITNSGGCPSDFAWQVVQTGGSIPASVGAGGSGSVFLQPNQTDSGQVDVSIDSSAGAGSSVLTLFAYDDAGQLVCQDPGTITITPQDSWGPFIGTSIGMPPLFLDTVNNLVSAIPGVGVTIEEATFSMQERSRDCCFNGQQVSGGEIEGEGSLSFTILGEGPVPVLPFISFDVDVDLGFVEVEVTADIGLYWGFDVGFGGTAGRRVNACTGVDCYYGGVGVSAELSVMVDLDAIACVEVDLWFLDGERCAGFTITPVGVSAAFNADIGWNLDSCMSGVDINASIGAIQVYADFKVWYVGHLSFRRTVFDGFPLF